MKEVQPLTSPRSKSEFETALSEKDSLMVVDCFATWCGPCKIIAPEVVKYVVLAFLHSLTLLSLPPSFIPLFSVRLSVPIPSIQTTDSIIKRRFSESYPSARFYKLDVDEVPDVAQELGIRAMPTFLLFKDGERVGEVVGANPKALEAAIQKQVGA